MLYACMGLYVWVHACYVMVCDVCVLCMCVCMFVCKYGMLYMLCMDARMERYVCMFVVYVCMYVMYVCM